jgi:hypothetical protein
LDFEGDDAMFRHVALTISALVATSEAPRTMAAAQSDDGLRVWITRGGSYCIRDVAVFGKVRCQREGAWAKEGVTFTRSHAPSQLATTANPVKE